MLIITLIIAILTLIERKILALVQRRVGPYYVGYKGRLQYLADALKLFLKEISIPYKINKKLYIFFPSIISIFSYMFWINTVWSTNISIIEFEYNIILFFLISFCFNFCIILTGYYSKNKFAIISAIRSCIIFINIELLLGFFFFSFILFVESFSFNVFVIFQENYWFFFLFFFYIGFFFMIFLLETNRSPFDLVEAESELIAGYSSEYGSFCFALYYLGEYFHLFFFSFVLAIIIFGGWEFINIFNNIFFIIKIF